MEISCTSWIRRILNKYYEPMHNMQFSNESLEIFNSAIELPILWAIIYSKSDGHGIWLFFNTWAFFFSIVYLFEQCDQSSIVWGLSVLQGLIFHFCL